MKQYLLLLYIFCFIGSYSCVTQRKVEYLQDKDNSVKIFSESPIPIYKLKANDELYIQISSLDESASNVFSGGTNNPLSMGGMQPYGASLISYAISSDGYLQLPILGSLYVKDLTIAQLSLSIKDSLKRILNQPMITIKLVNRYISVLGEVKAPGHYSYSQDKLSVYDALGLSGDITEYGDRNQVILIRNEHGKNFRISVDLTKADVLASEYYYLRPNDIVYVKPLKKKFWGMKEFPFSVLLSSITTAVLVLSYVKKF